MPVVEIKPGIDLDRAVAEAIGECFGKAEPYNICGAALAGNTICCRCEQPFSEVGRAAQDFQHCPTCRAEWEADKRASGPPPRYSTDLNAAFAAVERVSSYCYLFTSEDLGGKWECKLSPRDSFNELVHANTPALAICAAILKLKE